MADVKYCSACGKTLPLEEFYKNSRAKDGLQRRCKLCKLAENKRYHESDRAVALAAIRQAEKKEAKRQADANIIARGLELKAAMDQTRSVQPLKISEHEQEYNQRYYRENKERIAARRKLADAERRALRRALKHEPSAPKPPTIDLNITTHLADRDRYLSTYVYKYLRAMGLMAIGITDEACEQLAKKSIADGAKSWDESLDIAHDPSTWLNVSLTTLRAIAQGGLSMSAKQVAARTLRRLGAES